MPATFKFYLREDRPDNRGYCPLYLRITENRKSKYVSSGIRLKPNQWNDGKEKVKAKHRTPDKLNDELAIIRADAEQAYRDLKRQKQSSADAIKKRLEHSSKDNFFKLAEDYQKEIKQTSYYTWKQNRVAIKKLREHHGSDDLPLNFIDPVFLNEFVSKLQSKYKNKASTIHKNIASIKAILDKAVLYKLIPKNPVEDKTFNLPKKNQPSSKTKLSLLQIDKLENLDLEPDSNLWHARNAFILSFYFCGMRVGDLVGLKWKNVINDRLKYKMNKTGVNIDVKIPDDCKKYLDFYRNDDSKDDDFILPFLADLSPEELKDSVIIKKQTESATTTINGKNTDKKISGLKKLAKLAGIKENLSMHASRHSFAQYAIEKKKIPVYKLMILLGHQNIKTTMQYLKTINVQAADEAIDEIF
ncbi:MAG: site-specific integrase [Balneolaceae bacterium]|nr:site-specific integrase [Balneolaceae bacterium]